MECGFTTARGLIGDARADGDESRLIFVVTGVPTAANPVSAFKQGLPEEPANRLYPIVGARCSQCGFLEFYAGPREA